MRIRPWWIFLCAAVLTAAVYAPGLSGGWLFDDYPNIVDNAGVQPQDMSVASLTRAALSSPSSTFKRPLASLTFAFNYLAGGLDPFGWKMVNLLIHLLNGLLVFLLARGVLRHVRERRWGNADFRAHPTPTLPSRGEGGQRSASPPFEGGEEARRERAIGSRVYERLKGRTTERGLSDITAALIAGAWMLLPINLTGVLYVVQRMESLANLFVLLGLWGYVAGRRRMRAGRRGLWLCVVGLIAATTLGLTAKETAVMLPLYAFLVEWIVFRFRAYRGTRRTMDSGLRRNDGQHRQTRQSPVTPAKAGVHSDPADETAMDSGLRRNDDNHLPTGQSTVIPAKAGIHSDAATETAMDSGLRRNDGQHRQTRQPTVTPAKAGVHSDAAGETAMDSGLRRNDGGSRRDGRIVGLFVVLLLLPLLAGLVWIVPNVLEPSTWATRDFTLATRLLSEARIVVDYIAWTLMPLPTWLSFYHDGFVVSQGLLQPGTALASMGVLAALLALAWWQRHRRPLVTLGIALYFGCHLLTATILPLELVYEHRNYFASFGLLLAVVPVLLEAGRGLRARRALLGVLAAWWIALTAFTAYQWGEPLRLATELAARAPESPRAQYTLGRLLLMRGNYNPKSPYTKRAYAPLERAAALPGSSILPLQALLFMNVRMGQPVKPAWWDRLIAKLEAEPLGVQDDSSLVAMTDCAVDGDCPFHHRRMVAAFGAALSHQSPSAQVLAAYGNYAWNVLGDRQLAVHMTERAIRTAPNEPAYRVTLARMAAVLGRADVIRLQLRALKRLNYGGRLNHHIAELERLLDR